MEYKDNLLTKIGIFTYAAFGVFVVISQECLNKIKDTSWLIISFLSQERKKGGSDGNESK